jgi:fibronectin-binding autotransporter adhesin
MKKQLPLYLVMLSVILLVGGDKLSAQTLTFDPLGTPATGSFGSGFWNDGGTFEAPVAGTTLDWSNGTTDQAYIDGNNGVVFGGTNASNATATVTLQDTVYPGTASGNTASITFNTSGYDIVPSAPTDVINFEDQNAVTVAAGVSAEIDAQLGTDASSSATSHDISITDNTGSVLTLRGGTNFDVQTTGKSVSFGGGGTVNMDGAVGVTSNGTSAATETVYYVGTFFVGSGTTNLNVGASISGNDKAGLAIGQGDDVPTGVGFFNINGGIVNAFNVDQGHGNTNTVSVNSGVFSANDYNLVNGDTSGSPQTVTLNVNGGQFIQTGNMNILASTSPTSGPTNFAAVLNFTGGVSVLEHGIIIGNSSGPAVGNTNSAAITVSGGAVYLGSTGIESGTDGIASDDSVTAAQTSITLSGGTVGALANWSTSENMTLSNTNGGVTFQTSDVGSTIASQFAGNNGNPNNTNSNTATGNTHIITLSGILSGNGPLTASGGGHLITTGANTYSGGTSVVGGTQLTLASAGTGNVHVDANISQISDLQLTLSTAIAATATLTLDSATASEVDLNFLTAGTTDVIGGLVIDGTSLAAGVYTVTQLDSMTIGGVTVQDFTDNAGGTNSFTILSVPEPSTWALMLGGLGLVGLVTRRRFAADRI